MLTYNPSLSFGARGDETVGAVDATPNASLGNSAKDWEVYRETFAYIERLGLPKEVTDAILHHNAQKLFGFDH